MDPLRNQRKTAGARKGRIRDKFLPYGFTIGFQEDSVDIIRFSIGFC
jgi:hypothetical protein